MTTSNISMTNSSSNGYCKMGDGTLIQWGQLNLGSKSTSTVGALYGTMYSNVLTFPMPFLSDNDVSVQVSPLGGGYEIITAISANRLGIASMDVARPTNGNITGIFSWLAIGRWK